MDSDSGGIPPDIGLSTVALAVTSSMEVIEEGDDCQYNSELTLGEGMKHNQGNVNVKTPVITQTVSKNINIIHNIPIVGETNGSQVQGQFLESFTPSDKNREQKPVHKYEKSDSGPYHVYIEYIDKTFTGRLNAMKVGEIVLLTHPELDNKIKNIESIGRNRVRVVFNDADSANSLSGSSRLKNRGLDSYIPKFILFRQGVVRGVDKEYSEEYLQGKIKAYDFNNNIAVDKVTRIFRKVMGIEKTEYVPTQSIIVSFKSQKLPKYVTINRVIASVEPYVQKVLLCFNCYRYGHLGKQCKSTVRCLRCGDKHSSATCNNTVNDPICFHCKGKHLTTDFNKCPEFKRQKEIKKIMCETNSSYRDAVKNVPSNTYANVVTNSLNASSNVNYQQRNNSPLSSFSFTQPRHSIISQPSQRNKRPRSVSPSHLQVHKQLLSPVNLPHAPGGITSKSIYQQNVQSSHINSIPNKSQIPATDLQNIAKDFSLMEAASLSNNDNIITTVVEAVISVINLMKQNNSFEMNEREIVKLIHRKLNLPTTDINLHNE